MRQMRRAKSPEFWKKHIETWRELGEVPLSEYCKEHGLLDIQFTHWIEKYNKIDQFLIAKNILKNKNKIYCNLSNHIFADYYISVTNLSHILIYFLKHEFTFFEKRFYTFYAA